MKAVHKIIVLFALFTLFSGTMVIAENNLSPLNFPKPLQLLQRIVRPAPQPQIITSVPLQKKVIPPDTEPWGVAKKIGEHTYTIKVGEDERMATPQEILDALNSYRQTQGKGTLQRDNKLASYAQERAQFFSEKGSTDAHAGFNDYLDNQDGFTKLGFDRLGENSYYGGKLYGVHLIEWIFAKSPEHNANQLDSGWSHVGIGVSGYGVNLIFGGGKI